MSEVRVVRTWDELPPVVNDHFESFSTRILERKYRAMRDTLCAIANNGLDASQCRRSAMIALAVEKGDGNYVGNGCSKPIPDGEG